MQSGRFEDAAALKAQQDKARQEAADAALKLKRDYVPTAQEEQDLADFLAYPEPGLTYEGVGNIMAANQSYRPMLADSRASQAAFKQSLIDKYRRQDIGLPEIPEPSAEEQARFAERTATPAPEPYIQEDFDPDVLREQAAQYQARTAELEPALPQTTAALQLDPEPLPTTFSLRDPVIAADQPLNVPDVVAFNEARQQLAATAATAEPASRAAFDQARQNLSSMLAEAPPPETDIDTDDMQVTTPLEQPAFFPEQNMLLPDALVPAVASSVATATGITPYAAAIAPNTAALAGNATSSLGSAVSNTLDPAMIATVAGVGLGLYALYNILPSVKTAMDPQNEVQAPYRAGYVYIPEGDTGRWPGVPAERYVPANQRVVFPAGNLPAGQQRYLSKRYTEEELRAKRKRSSAMYSDPDFEPEFALEAEAKENEVRPAVAAKENEVRPAVAAKENEVRPAVATAVDDEAVEHNTDVGVPALDSTAVTVQTPEDALPAQRNADQEPDEPDMTLSEEEAAGLGLEEPEFAPYLTDAALQRQQQKRDAELERQQQKRDRAEAEDAIMRRAAPATPQRLPDVDESATDDETDEEFAPYLTEEELQRRAHNGDNVASTAAAGTPAAGVPPERPGGTNGQWGVSAYSGPVGEYANVTRLPDSAAPAGVLRQEILEQRKRAQSEFVDQSLAPVEALSAAFQPPIPGVAPYYYGRYTSVFMG